MSEQQQEPVVWRTSAYEMHPACQCIGKLTKWEARKGSAEYGGQQQVKLTFVTDYDDEDSPTDEPWSITVWGTPTIGPKGKVGKYLMAVGVSKEDLEDKEFAKTFDLDEYLNIPVGLTIVHEPNQKGEIRDKVAAFSPVPRKRRRQVVEEEGAPQPAPAPPTTAPARAAAHEQPRPAARRRIADEDEEEQQAKHPVTAGKQDPFEKE